MDKYENTDIRLAFKLLSKIIGSGITKYLSELFSLELSFNGLGYSNFLSSNFSN